MTPINTEGREPGSRKQGFYHVRVGDIWEVAEWYEEYNEKPHWYKTGRAYHYFDDELQEIDERRIVRETEPTETQEHWISVNDKQPTDYGRYMIFRRDAGKVHFETWNTSGWAYNHNQITHWMRIPEPPRKPEPNT